MFELERDGEVARLLLRRPEARNAIPVAGWDVLAAKLDEVDASGARVLVVASAGGAFCAGADLGDFAAMHRDEAAAAAFRKAMRRGLTRLTELPMPVVALVEGDCYGAGVALALACDIRLAGASARFAITPARISIAYPQQDVARLVALVGAGQAARLLFTGSGIDAAEAKRIGLADADSGDLDGFLAAIVANDRLSLATLKRSIALALRGVERDAAQDRAFDALLASDALAGRLAARHRR